MPRVLKDAAAADIDWVQLHLITNEVTIHFQQKDAAGTVIGGDEVRIPLSQVSSATLVTALKAKLRTALGDSSIVVAAPKPSTKATRRG